MAGPIEESAKVVSATVDALRSTPVILAMVFLNVLYVGLILYIAKASGDRWQSIVDSLLKAALSCGGKQ